MAIVVVVDDDDVVIVVIVVVTVAIAVVVIVALVLVLVLAAGIHLGSPEHIFDLSRLRVICELEQLQPSRHRSRTETTCTGEGAAGTIGA